MRLVMCTATPHAQAEVLMKISAFGNPCFERCSHVPRGRVSGSTQHVGRAPQLLSSIGH